MNKNTDNFQNKMFNSFEKRLQTNYKSIVHLHFGLCKVFKTIGQ